MKNNNYNPNDFSGQRLLGARKISGLTLQGLADKMNMEISKQALNQFEKGQSKPTEKVLIALADALNTPVDYFFKKTDIIIENIEFRQKKKLTDKELDSIKYKAISYIEKTLEIEGILDIKNLFINPFHKTTVKNKQDAEKLSIELRKAWMQCNEPVADVIRLLEMNGVKVVEVETPNYFSGMSTMVNDIAVIVINSDMNSVRKRLTALHELAHIILTFPKGMDDEEIEDICFYFAAAFLVPAEVIFNDLGMRRTNLLLDEVIKFENYYGISVQAFVRRIFNLGIISESKFNSFKHWLNRTEMKDAEIGSFWSLESPSRLRELVIKALSLEIITESKAAALLDIPLSQLIDERTEII